MLANAALTLDRRIAVNLNYTASSVVMNQCIAQCGIRHVLTSPRLLERFPLKLDAELVHVEDLREKVSPADKLIAAAADVAAACGRVGALAGPDADQDG